MDALKDAARALAENLASSACCRAYQEAKAAVNERSMLLLKLDAYKKKHIAYRTAIANGAPPIPETEAELNELYWSLMLDSRARRFLESEQEVITLFSALCGVIAEACPVDPSFPNL